MGIGVVWRVLRLSVVHCFVCGVIPHLLKERSSSFSVIEKGMSVLCTFMFGGLNLAVGRIVNFCIHLISVYMYFPLPLECVYVRDDSFFGMFHVDL